MCPCRWGCHLRFQKNRRTSHETEVRHAPCGDLESEPPFEHGMAMGRDICRVGRVASTWARPARSEERCLAHKWEPERMEMAKFGSDGHPRELLQGGVLFTLSRCGIGHVVSMPHGIRP